MSKDPLWLFLMLGGLLFGVVGLQKEWRLFRVSEGDILRLENQSTQT